jgi:hypothetical protein
MLLMNNLATITRKDNGQSWHGTITHWVNGLDEFWFVPCGGSVINQIWCKCDFWSVSIGIKIGNLISNDGGVK